MVTLSPVPKLHFDDANGEPLVGGLLNTYVAGTTDRLTTYTDSTRNTPNTNPIILDAFGEASVWLDQLSYKYVVTTPTGGSPRTTDNILAIQSVSNTFVYELGTTAAAASHAGIITGHIIKTNYLDSNRIAGSGSEVAFTGTTTIGEASKWPNDAGLFHDALGQQFAFISGARVAVQIFGVEGDASCEGVKIDKAVAGLSARGGGTLVFSNETGTYFASTAPIILPSHVWIEIAAGSRLHNLYDFGASAGEIQTGVNVLMGEYNPGYEGVWTEYDVDTADESDLTVDLSTPSDISNFAVGDLVMVISGDGNYRQLTKVTALSSPTITLQDRLGRALPASSKITLGSGASLLFTPTNQAGTSYSADITDPSGFVEDCGITGPGRVTGPDALSARNAVYGGAIRDLEIQVRYPIFGNAYTHFDFHDLYGTYTYRCIEIADGAFDVDIDNIHFDCVAASATDAAIIPLNIIKGIGVEGRINNFVITDHVEREEALLLEVDFEFNSEYSNGLIKSTATNAATTLNVIRRDDAGPNRNVKYKHLRFELAQSTVSRYIQHAAGVIGGDFDDVEFIHSGTVTNDAVRLLTGTTDVNFHNLRCPAGTLTLDAGVIGNRFEDSTFNNIVFGAGAINTLHNVERLICKGFRDAGSFTNLVSTSSLTPVTLMSLVIPIGTLALPGDYIDFFFIMRIVGANDDKTISMIDDSGSLFTFTYGAGDTGYTTVSGRIIQQTLDGKNWDMNFSYEDSTGVVIQTAIQRANIDVPGAGWTFELQGVVANGGDTVLLESGQFTPRLRYWDIN